MKILYLWIENFKHISKQGFNLSSEYFFDLVGNTLRIKENTSYIPNFYNTEHSESRISSLTCLIGSNAAGKSTLLDFLKIILTSGYTEDYKNFNFILAFEAEQKMFVYISPNLSQKQKINISNVIKLKKINGDEFEFYRHQMKLIFYSNVFDCSAESSVEISGSNNISTNFLINYSAKSLVENHHIEGVTASSLQAEFQKWQENLNKKTIDFDDNHKEECANLNKSLVEVDIKNSLDEFKFIFKLPILINFYSKHKDLMAVSDNSPSHSTFRQSLRELEVLLKQLNENSENQQRHNQVFFFKFQELEKQLEYLSEFERPVSNKFFIDSLEIHLFSNKLLTTDNTKLESFPPRLKEFLQENEELLYKKKNQGGADLQSLKWGFMHSYWILFIRMLYQYSDYLKDIEQVELEAIADKNSNVEEFVKWQFIKLLPSYLPPSMEMGENMIVSNKFAQELINKIRSFEKFLASFELLNPSHIFPSSIYLKIDNNVENIKKCFSHYKNSIFQTGAYSTFEWKPKMSSGEKSMLTLFSRLYSLVTKFSWLKKDFPENILLLIDEGELYFHPQWQKDYIYLLIDNLPKIFSNTKVKNIQLLITSNTPLILTDILPSDTIYLKDGAVINKKLSSFGANLNDLYTDSFFIKDGLIGKLAQNKINTILQIIESDESSEDDLLLAKKIISNISDDFVRKYLNNKLASKSIEPSKKDKKI